MTATELPRQRLRKGSDIPERITRMIHGRSGGVCDICCGASAAEIHHRQRKGMGGTRNPAIHDPSNLLDLCWKCHHKWVHARRVEAGVAGWIVPTWLSPLVVPVWTVTPFAGWSLLLDDDAMVCAASPRDFDLPIRPPLPPWADLAAIGATDPWSTL